MATPAARSATALSALDHLVWRGDRLAVEAAPGRPTVLPGGGWPTGALTELLIPHFGVGELGLLLPQLRNIPAGRWGVCIAPPGLPYAPALAAAGVPLGRLLLVQAESPAHARWACRQALASRSCEIVLLWLAEADMAALRGRHHRAASQARRGPAPPATGCRRQRRTPGPGAPGQRGRSGLPGCATPGTECRPGWRPGPCAQTPWAHAGCPRAPHAALVRSPLPPRSGHSDGEQHRHSHLPPSFRP